MTPRSVAHGTASAASRTLATLLAVAFLAAVLSGPHVARAAVAPRSFPRLVTWWPDTEAASAASLARYDVIVLQAPDAPHIAALRARNPNVFLLGNTSARELNYDLDDYDAPANVELRSVSTDWMLTQVGSALTADIDASTTSIPVADVHRFEAGEMVLVDHELMHVEAIGASSLTVAERGPVNPPAPHGSGTRIASVVSHWPGTISFDLTDDCPRRDVGYGDETWRDWDVRRGRAVEDEADWDGLFIDALEPTESWMVTTGDVRSIDPLRTNVPVTDHYAAFDAAWGVGAVAYGRELRVASGDRVLISNGNLRNFALNGIIFEEYPYPGLPLVAWNVVFRGPFAAPYASYPEWLAGAAAPHLTTVQVYGAANNYKLMRYGLCTALMNDGFFAYARNSTLHASTRLDWFDEYDNAGAGRGYLGAPKGSAKKVGNAWRRDYTGGIALVNPTAGTVTVHLGATFRKIKGTQSPKVNSGAKVSSVTITARDGIVLLRIPTVTLRASSTAISYGRETTLQVSVAPVPSRAVRIEKRAAGASKWSLSAAVTLDDAGGVLLARSPRVTTEYRAVLVGAGAASKILKIGVRPLVTIKASRTRLDGVGRVVFSGKVTHPGHVPVVLQRRVGGKWRNVRRFVTSLSGRYSTTVSFARDGKFSYRVHVAGDTSHLSAASGTVVITVE